VKLNKIFYVAIVVLGCALAAQSRAGDGTGGVTLIHMGDLHGHLIPHPSVRSDSEGQYEGGVARIYTLIEQIRDAHPQQTLLVNTGDTLHGGAEVLFTQGAAIIGVLNEFGIDAYAVGNWDYVYGTDKFLKYFVGAQATANWHPIIANLYYDHCPGAEDKTGQRPVVPYLIKTVNGLRIGIIGLTSERGPQAGDPMITQGLKFTDGKAEYARYVKEVRAQNVDLVVVISELGLHENLTLADQIPGADVILSSDKHEVTPKPLVSRQGTLVLEQGMDGQVVGELSVTVVHGIVTDTKYVSHRITEKIQENPRIAAMVEAVRAPLVAGAHFRPGAIKNPFSGAALRLPIDTVIGQTRVALYRSNFSDELMPAVVEGSSHDFLADAFRVMTGAQLGSITGFRYGTVVLPGPIKLEDLYHFMPVGAQIAKGELTGAQIKKTLEGQPQGDIGRRGEWGNGWLAGYSGLTADFNPAAPQGRRVSNIRIGGKLLNPDSSYTVGGFYYDLVPNLINRVQAKNITVLKDTDGGVFDGTDIAKRYVESLPAQTVGPDSLPLNRIHLLAPLPKAEHGMREIQPLGALSE